jgi:6-phosphogluconolactonase
MTKRLLYVLLGVALLGGCSDDGDTTKKDSSAPGPDTAKADVVVADTMVKNDVAEPDTAKADGPVADGPLADTLKPDAAVPDVPVADVAITDSSIADSKGIDGGVDLSIGEAGVTEAGARDTTRILDTGVTEAAVTEAGTSTGPKQMVYVGCKGSSDSPADLRIFTMNPTTGELTAVGNYNPGSSLSFPAVHPSHKYLYVTKSVEDKVLSLAIDQATGLLSDNGASETIVSEPSGVDGGTPAAANPVYALVDSTGTWLVATTYAGNNVNVFKLGSDGKVGALVSKHSMGVHAHSAAFDPQERYLLVPYHGSDIIGQYYFNSTTGALTTNVVPSLSVGAGEGPRHLDFHPNGRWVYLVTETLANVKLLIFDSVSGRLSVSQTVSAVRADYTGKKYAADIHVAKVGPTAGKYLYVSNREEQTLVVFSINQTDGKLTEIQHLDLTPNKTPRTFNIDESGKFLLESNQDTANIGTYAIDQSTGMLSKLSEYPVCVAPYFVVNVSVPKTVD